MTRPVPDPLPLRPVDRCRSLLLPWGRPGLDHSCRPGLPDIAVVQTGLADLEARLTLAPARRAVVVAVVWCWHDDLPRAWAALEGVTDPLAAALAVVLARRAGDEAAARGWLERAGQHPVWARLRPVAAAEGLAGPLVDGPRFRAEVFLGHCLRPRPEERQALERLQAAEVLGVLAAAIEGVSESGR